MLTWPLPLETQSLSKPFCFSLQLQPPPPLPSITFPWKRLLWPMLRRSIIRDADVGLAYHKGDGWCFLFFLPFFFLKKRISINIGLWGSNSVERSGPSIKIDEMIGEATQPVVIHWRRKRKPLFAGHSLGKSTAENPATGSRNWRYPFRHVADFRQPLTKRSKIWGKRGKIPDAMSHVHDMQQHSYTAGASHNDFKG